jgi:DNA-binding response OmpR family regulator
MSGGMGRILVVEDDDILRETLVEVVGDEGYEVRSAPNGGAALLELEAWTPQLIILDLMMPHMDAYEFRERQREAGIATGARILILSAARDLEAAAARIGADDWIAKPFRLVEVLDAVERLIHKPAA